MGRNALRRITEVYNTSGRFPTLDELEDWISDHHRQAIRFIDDYDRTVLNAAIFALDVYSLEEYAKRVMWASNGGKKSGWKKGARGKRPPTYTTTQLREVEDLSIAQQADKLGCSPATIKRIRARLKAEKAAAQEAELDALFGPQEAVQPLSEDEEDALLASLDDHSHRRPFPKMSPEAAPGAEPVRITPMSDPIPDHVPASWIDNVHELVAQNQRELEANVSFATFEEIEL
ncbi:MULTISPECIES: hypothetical protein [Microbacterium]|nr:MULTISPECIES: hypothetical protein [Microbacterium]